MLSDAAQALAVATLRQGDFQAACAELSQRGVNWMLSNSDTPYTREVFGAIPGAQLHTVYAGRSVNRDKDGRGKVSEIVVVGQAR